MPETSQTTAPRSRDLVRVERDGPVVVVTLHRPEALNALSRALREALAETFDQLTDDASVEAVVFTGAGRAFCAGLDLKELGGEVTPAGAVQDAAPADPYRAMMRFDRPIVGAINGVAITGGFELALACDVLIASPEARFADTHARVGVVPGWGLSQRLPRLIGPMRAKELSLTGNYLDAATAERWGLVNRVVPREELLPAARELAAEMCTTDPRTRAEILRLIDHAMDSTLVDGLAEERRASEEHSRREVSAEKVRARRLEIQERGRRQQD